MQYLLVFLIVLGVGLPALQLPAILWALAVDSTVVREPRALWLAGGLVAGVLTSLWLRRSSRMRFLTTLLHELSHLSIGLLLGTSPRSLSAGEQAGLFQYELRGPVPKLRAFFITVAPYWLSPLLVAPIVLALFVPSASGWRLGFLSWLLAICLTLPLAEIHTRQPDLQRYRVAPPIAAALWLWAGLAALTLTLVFSGSVTSTVELYPKSWSRVVSAVHE